MKRVRRLPAEWLLLGAGWFAASAAVALFAGKARDWFDMTDELRYERLAESIARTHSFVPRIHGQLVESWAQLYPALIAPVFGHDTAVGDVHAAHVLNAVIISSVVVPAYLLGRRVIGSRVLAAGVAVFSVAMPWIVYAGMLMTEVAAYPAFVWAAYLVHRSLAEPSRRNDLLALAGIGLAFLGRTALLTLALVYPLVIAIRALRDRRAPGAVLRERRLLCVAYGIGALVAVALAATHDFSRVYGIYSHYTGHADWRTTAVWGSLVEHYATFALGTGIAPLVVGGAWLLTRAVTDASGERGAFATFAALVIVLVPLQVTDFDVRYNLAFVHDRFFIYLLPLLLCAVACAITERGIAVWAAVVVTATVAAGFVVGAIPAFTWLQFRTINPDTPASSLYRPLADAFGGLSGARVFLVVATVAVGCASIWAYRRPVGVVIVVIAAAGLSSSTFVVLDRYLTKPGWSGRPVTASPAGTADWIDAATGPNARVAAIPSPISSDWFVSQQFWRDLEFWNRSYVADVHYPGPDAFEYTGFWFPKAFPGLNPSTGAVDDTVTAPYAVQSVIDTRFRLRGKEVASTPNAVLLAAGQPWHLDWLSNGLYDDGWTRPGRTAKIRVFALPNQHHPVVRALDVALRAPDNVANRAVAIRSNRGSWRVDAQPGNSFHQRIEVCVPPRGGADVSIRAAEDSPIPGDLRSLAAVGDTTRAGGVLVASIGLSDDLGGGC